MPKPSRPATILTCACGNTITLAVGRMADSAQIGKAAQGQGWRHIKRGEFLCKDCVTAGKAARNG